MSAHAPDEDLTGKTLGSYELTGIIGRGSLGVVYSARHTQLGGVSACKVLRSELAKDHALIERFLAEAKRATRVRHPNVIDIFDIGELSDGRIYYVMEQLTGQPLSEVLRAGRRPFTEVVEIGRQLCEGLAAAHAAGVIQHDLRLASIYLLSRPGELPLVKLADFGLTRVAELSRREARGIGRRQVFGAPEHLAPERIRSGAGDERADGYALAAVLYHLCTGVPLFTQKGTGDLLRAQLYTPPPTLDPASLLAGVPRDMDALLQKALAKDPADRYATIQQLEADLLRIARGEPPLALSYYREHTQGSLAALRRRLAFVRTNRWVPPVALLLLLVVTGCVYLGARALSSWASARRNRGRVTEVNVVAMRALAIGVLQEGLRAADPNQRALALRALGQSRDPRHRETLQAYLQDPVPQIRSEAAAALGTLNVRSAAPALLHCAQTATDPPTLLACAEALDHLDIEAALAVLKTVMASPDLASAVPAALALEARGDADARKFLDDRLTNPKIDAAERALVLERRALRGDKVAQAQAQTLLRDHRPEAAPGPVRLEVAASLVKLDDPRARSELVETVEQGGPLQVLAAQLLCATDDLFGQPLLRQVFRESSRPLADRLLATSGLGSCGDRDDLQNLAQTLQRGEPERTLRQAEAGSLLRLCSNDPAVLSEQSLSVAMAGLHDDSPLWREAAVAALTGADPQQSVPLLGQVLKEDQQPEVRRRAANALGRTHQAGAMAVLGAAMNDQNRDVRFTVFRSIGEVGSSPTVAAAIDPAVRSQVQSELTARTQSADPAEQLVASAALMRLGDERQRDKLRSGLATSDREALQVAIAEVAADREMQRKNLPQLLNHPDFAVRMQVASALAMAGEPSGIGVLREALSRGEAEAVRAYGLLLKLGQTVTLPEHWAAPLTSGELTMRLATIEATLQLPADLAIDLLARASRDPDPIVRRRVVELLGEIPLGGRLSTAVSLLRRLQNDSDAVVRSLATVVLAKRLPRRGSEAPAASSASSRRVTATLAVPDLASPVAAAADGGSVSDEPPPAEPTPVPDAGAEPPPAETPTETPTDSANSHDQLGTIRKAIASGLSALKNKEPGKAQRVLEKINSACARSRKEAAVACAEMSDELSLALGQVYEAQSQWALAMREYDKVRPGVGAHSPTSQQRAEVSAAIRRLSPKLGRVIIPSIVHKRCQESVVFMVPGTHTVNLQGSTQQVRVRAQETVKVGQCP